MENHLTATISTQDDAISSNLNVEAKNILKILDELQDFTENLRKRLMSELRA